MLISWVLGRALNIQQIRPTKNKYNKNDLKAAFCLLELLVYIQLVTCTRLLCNAQLTVSIICAFRRRSLQHAASKLFDEIEIFSEKMSLKRRRKIDRIS